MNADNRVLESIIHCELLARCKAGEDMPCSMIISVQDVRLREQQVPEPWTGHLDRARLVFISSNPSIDPHEAYPRWGDDIAEFVRYFTDRFDGGPGQIRHGSTVRYPKVTGPVLSVSGRRYGSGHSN